MFGKRVGRVGGVGNVGGARKGPSFALDFINGLSSGDPRLTATRAAGGATNFNSNGTQVLSAANTQRIDYEQVRQQLSNTNAYTSGGANANALSADVPPLFSGTAVVKSVITQSGVNTNCMAASFTPIIVTPIVASMYVWIPSAFTGTSVAVSIEGTGTGTPSMSASLVLRDQWQRIQATTATSASSGFSNIVLRVIAANGQFIYFTGIQMEYGSTASVYQIATGGVVTTASRGLLVEEARTNSLRNPRAEGSTAGVLGSGGVLPTNWSESNSTGIAPTIVGTGTENGIPYIDIRFVGTAAAGVHNIFFETTSGTAASPAQAWSASFYWRLVGGTLTNISAASAQIEYDDNTSTFISTPSASITLPTAAPLGPQRQSVVNTTAPALTAFVRSLANFAVAAGAVDATIRFGAPQLELGVFVTSAILPAVGTPLATTRAADQVIINPFTPAANMTFEIEALIPTLPPAGGAGNARILSADDGTVNNRITTVILAADTHVTILEASSSVLVQPPTTGVVTPGVAFKYACAVDGSVRFTLNGATPQSATNPVPIGINRVTFGYEAGLATQINGYVRKVNYWPRALTNAELQVQTT